VKSVNHISEFIHEAYIMTRLQHENLLRILGITFFGEEKQLSLVTDFMKNGSLLDYLRNNREVFQRLDSNEITIKLNSFAKQIFQAMLYLEEKSIIHRDLAARNCLIGENDNLKVADFGLTKFVISLSNNFEKFLFDFKID
jgi:serine/threonine protein kinase